MVIGVFVLVLMGAISASFYTVERSAAVTAVAAGARAAATANPGNPNQPNLAAAQAAVTQVTREAMFGTAVAVVQQPANSPCAAGGTGQVTVCVEQVTDSAGALDMVSVHMVGTPHNPVPTFGIFNWSLDVEARVHQVTFLP